MYKEENTMYTVYENRNTGIKGKPFMAETALFSGTKEECAEYGDMKRKEYARQYGDQFGTFVDCYTRSDEETDRIERAKAIYDTLTDEQKNDIIEVDGRKYIRAIYEANHK